MGLPLVALSSVSAGLLMAIPFFGPFVAWAPPVIVALLFQPDALLPTTALMAAGWFVVMNVLQPRIMQGAVGIHPIVVLGSVLIGSRIAGIPGAIFGIPIAAVASAFFFHFLHRSSGDRTVAGRAAKRVSRARGPARPGPARAGAGHGRRRRRTPAPTPTPTTPTVRRGRRGRHVSDDPPDMTRERARTERRDLDKERGEPVAGGVGTGRPARRCAATPGRCASGRAGRGSSSPTTTASSRAACSRSSRRSTRSATSRSSRPTRTRARSATRRR